VVAIWVAASQASMGEGSAALAVSRALAREDTTANGATGANGFTTLVISGTTSMTSAGTAMVTAATTTRPTTHTTARRRITNGDLTCELTMSVKMRNGLRRDAAEPVPASWIAALTYRRSGPLPP
jgi:hypothetical protein